MSRTMSDTSSKMGRIRAKLSLLGKLQIALNNVRKPETAASSQQNLAPKQTGLVIPSKWKESFEQLIADPEGLKAFTAFLHTEYSDENIRFWQDCSEYSKITDECDRKQKANEIYTIYLSGGATDPVNVDSEALRLVKENLESAPPDMFELASNQIFKLMKTDSYRRFLKTDTSKNTVEEKSKQQPPKSVPVPRKRYFSTSEVPNIKPLLAMQQSTVTSTPSTSSPKTVHKKSTPAAIDSTKRKNQETLLETNGNSNVDTANTPQKPAHSSGANLHIQETLVKRHSYGGLTKAQDASTKEETASQQAQHSIMHDPEIRLDQELEKILSEINQSCDNSELVNRGIQREARRMIRVMSESSS